MDHQPDDPPVAPATAVPPSVIDEGLFSPRNRRLLTVVLTLGSIALFFVVLGQVAAMWAIFSDLVLIFFFAWLLGFVLEPVAAWLARFMPRVLAVTIAYGSVAIAAFGLVILAASALITSTTEFLGNLSSFQRDLVALLQPLIDWLRTLGFDQVDISAQIDTVLRALATQAQDLLGPLQEIAVASVGVVGNLLIVFFLAIFISIDRAAIGSFLMRLVPPAYANEAHLLSESVGRSFGGFIRGMVVIGGTYAIVALIPNLLFGLDYAALTTAASGILMAIPFFGPFVAWSPPVIVAAVTQPDVLLPTLAIMVVGWFVNQNILQPRVLAGAVGLHPVVVLASVLIGMKLLGIPGAIFGLPVAAVISSFFFYFLRRSTGPDDRSVAARAARRVSEREGRPARVPREPRPGEVEEIEAEEVGGPADAVLPRCRRAAARCRRAGLGGPGRPRSPAAAGMTRRTRILVTNDDGIESRGLLALKQALEPLGEVVVIAPETNQSAVGHSRTMWRPLRVRERVLADGSPAWSIDGSPSDAVGLVFLGLLPGPIDLVASGINHGANLGDDITYSGTVSAAMEAILNGCPAFAISVDDYAPDDFELSIAAARVVAEAILARGLEPGQLLNVNVPAIPKAACAGFEVARLGKRTYQDELIRREDPRGVPYYWVGGSPPRGHAIPGTDVDAVANNRVAVTPIQLDLTADKFLERLRGWELALDG